MYHHFGPFGLLWYSLAGRHFLFLYIIQCSRFNLVVDCDKETSDVVTNAFKHDPIHPLNFLHAHHLLCVFTRISSIILILLQTRHALFNVHSPLSV